MANHYLIDFDLPNLSEVYLLPQTRTLIDDFVEEYNFREVLDKYDLPLTNKLLMYGYTGCGKTMSAKAIAKTLGKKIYTINLSNVVSSRLGETAKNISGVFAKAINQDAVLFFDEFDSLGKVRDYDNQESGEMKRIVNTILQLIDGFPKNAVLIAATNQREMIDEALLRRFQLHLFYDKPSSERLDAYYDHLLEKYPKQYQGIERRYDLSFAEAKDHTLLAVKKNVIEEAKKML